MSAGNALARVQRVHKPADLWDITFCTRWFWGFYYYVHPLFWDPELSRMHLHPQIQIPNAFPAFVIIYMYKIHKFWRDSLYLELLPPQPKQQSLVSAGGRSENLGVHLTIQNILLKQVCFYTSNKIAPPCTQLLGRLFSPSQKLKKWTHPFRLCFELGLGIHVHHAKY